MPGDLNVAAIRRSLTELGSKFQNHPQATQLAGVIYVCLGLGFIIIAGLALRVATSVLIAYVIGLSAIGLSAYTLNCLRTAGTVSGANPLPVPAVPPLPKRRQPKTEVQVKPEHTVEAAPASMEAYGDILDQADGALADTEVLSEVPSELDEMPVTTFARPVFKRSPVLTIPHRKIGLIAGEITAADGTPLAGSPEDLDELRLAHAVAYATKNEAAQGRAILIPLSRQSFDTNIIDEFIATAPELADRIVFELPESSLYDPGQDLLGAIQGYLDFGVRFAARKDTKFKVTDFIAHRALWSAFSYILMPAKVILATSPEIIELLEPLGAKLVALNVSSNDELLEILDFSVTLAAGPHFDLTAKMAGPTLFSVSTSEDTEEARRRAKELATSAASPSAAGLVVKSKQPCKSRSASPSSKRSTTAAKPKASKPTARRASAKKEPA